MQRKALIQIGLIILLIVAIVGITGIIILNTQSGDETDKAGQATRIADREIIEIQEIVEQETREQEIAPSEECDTEKNYCISQEQVEQYIKEETPLSPEDPSTTKDGQQIPDRQIEEDLQLLEYANTLPENLNIEPGIYLPETPLGFIPDLQACITEENCCNNPCNPVGFTPQCMSSNTVQSCLPMFIYYVNGLKKTCWQQKTSQCGTHQTCNQGTCWDIPDSSFYTPTDYGPLTPRTIYIDKAAMLAKYPQLQNLEGYYLYISENPTLSQSSNSIWLPAESTTIGGKTFLKMTYYPLGSGLIGPGNAHIHVTDFNNHIANNVLQLYIPNKVCSLVQGSGNSQNLDLVMLGDNYESNIELAAGVDRIINPAYGDIANAVTKLPKPYINKINLWIRNTPGIDCELSASQNNPGYDRITCDESDMENYGAACNYDINMAVSKFSGGVTSTADPESWINENLVFNIIYSVAGFPVSTIFLAYSFTNMELFYSGNPENIRGHTVAFVKNPTKKTFWHELGHAFGGSMDYYPFDEGCVAHPCVMCGYYDFTDDKQCRDAYNMIEAFNKGGYCDGQIEVSRIYPNPFNSVSSNPSYRNAKVQIRPVYAPYTTTFCYATLNVYNEQGKLIRTLVTDYPLTPDMYSTFGTEGPNNKNYIFRWDGKNFNGDYVASGRYFFGVSMKNARTTNNQDGEPLKVVLAK